MLRSNPFQAAFYAAGEFPFNDAISQQMLMAEETCVEQLLQHYQPDDNRIGSVTTLADELAQAARSPLNGMRVESFMQEYGLDNQEGVLLMCMAEALLRIPDTTTAERFLADKLQGGNWSQHLGHSSTFWVNLSTWSLVLTGKLISRDDSQPAGLSKRLRKLVRRLGEPLALTAVRQAMMMIAHQFVAGETIDSAIAANQEARNKRYFHSYDMLGEAALCQNDVDRYLDAYRNAIVALAKAHGDNPQLASLSVKLSALHPRFELRQTAGLSALRDNLHSVLSLAHEHNVAVTLDAEESWRLEPTLTLFADLLGCEPFRRWGRFGLAVQAYQKRALGVIDWLISLSKSIHCQIPVRLVKGAYWDTEIKQAQLLGLKDYPVFTQKTHTDLSYLVCAQRLFDERHFLYPQFATHNAYTIASILAWSDQHPHCQFEFQRLHGMGEALYDHLLSQFEQHHCRVYAPVGSHRELLPYLVRRLLENGANTSFVRLLNQPIDLRYLLEDPGQAIRHSGLKRHPHLVTPPRLYSPERPNSLGINLETRASLTELQNDLVPLLNHTWSFGATDVPAEARLALLSPANQQDSVGHITLLNEADCQQHFAKASAYAARWRCSPVDQRADWLHKAGELLEAHRLELVTLLMREAGKTLVNALGEVREAADFCYYYAAQARKHLAEPVELTGPTGESNQLFLEGRGPLLCISPWNFPLAIFTGQMAAALVAGNPVLAKPSLSTPLVAARTVDLFHQAGFPAESLHLLPTRARTLENTLLKEPQLAGILFTGSTETANHLNRVLANRPGPIVPLIAETGGLNAMIVDSSALPEQVVRDVVTSAFDSAGQRCSALRVLFVQNDVRERVLNLLCGYLDTLNIGQPSQWETDIGPVISAAAKQHLDHHIARFQASGRVIYQAPLPEFCAQGYYVPPTLIALDTLSELREEVFGPVLHVIGFDVERIDDLIDDINATGYGLTLGVHSRISEFCSLVAQRARVGNVYINRNMIGATVGVQPFGGNGLSGTGPKAGGPHYLLRLVNEKTCSINTAAIGGNTTLLTDY